MTKGAVSRRGGAPPRVHATGARGRCCVTFLSISLSLSRGIIRASLWGSSERAAGRPVANVC